MKICLFFLSNFFEKKRTKSFGFGKKSAPIRILKLDLGFGSRYRNLVSVIHYIGFKNHPCSPTQLGQLSSSDISLQSLTPSHCLQDGIQYWLSHLKYKGASQGQFTSSLPSGHSLKARPCPFIQISSRFYPNFIQIKSG